MKIQEKNIFMKKSSRSQETMAIYYVHTLPEEAMPLTIQRKTMIQAANKLTTIHQFRVPRSSTEGEMFSVSLYQKYVVGLLIYNHRNIIK
jgi:hypothetical protein